MFHLRPVLSAPADRVVSRALNVKTAPGATAGGAASSAAGGRRAPPAILRPRWRTPNPADRGLDPQGRATVCPLRLPPVEQRTPRRWAGNRQPQHERRPTAPCGGRPAAAVRSSGHGFLGSGPPRPRLKRHGGAAVTGGGEASRWPRPPRVVQPTGPPGARGRPPP